MPWLIASGVTVSSGRQFFHIKNVRRATPALRLRSTGVGEQLLAGSLHAAERPAATGRALWCVQSVGVRGLRG